MIDLHCHILPDIDDGATDLDTALAMARQAVEDGITHIVCTPHFRPPYDYARQLELRGQRLTTLREALAQAGLTLELLPGAEVQTQANTFEELLHDTPQLLVPGSGEDGDEPAALIELPMEMPVQWAKELFFLAQLHNTRMILAHPERQPEFLRHIDTLKGLLEQGMMLQFNANDLRPGFFHRRMNRAILDLMASAPQQVFLATDAHDPERRPCRISPARKIVTAALGEAAWSQMTTENPRRLLHLR